MRFIIKEQPYEQLLAAGELRYERDGIPTGAVEQWRLTSAVDGYRFLRVDLDARDAASGNSSLFHATLNPAGRCEGVKYRFWGQGLIVSGTLVLEDDGLVNGREVNGQRHEDVVDLEPGTAFWFPASIGLSLLMPLADGTHSAVTLSSATDDPAQAMAAQRHTISLTTLPTDAVQLMGNRVDSRPRQVAWSDQTRTLWLDDTGWPIRMARNDGLSAVETRLRRITNPA